MPAPHGGCGLRPIGGLTVWGRPGLRERVSLR
nr:MAG TPA: hypothetical protein [Caudoviricetes sp.]